MPSLTAMWRHWLRSCWVARMWCNATEEDPYNDLPGQCGWCRDAGGEYTYNWECPEVKSTITDTIHFLTRGCSCKKGCKTNQCGCRKKRNTCGPGCQCHGCTNAEDVTEAEPLSEWRELDTESESESSEYSSCYEAANSIQTEIVTDFTDVELRRHVRCVSPNKCTPRRERVTFNFDTWNKSIT